MSDEQNPATQTNGDPSKGYILVPITPPREKRIIRTLSIEVRRLLASYLARLSAKATPEDDLESLRAFEALFVAMRLSEQAHGEPHERETRDKQGLNEGQNHPAEAITREQIIRTVKDAQKRGQLR